MGRGISWRGVCSPGIWGMGGGLLALFIPSMYTVPHFGLGQKEARGGVVAILTSWQPFCFESVWWLFCLSAILWDWVRYLVAILGVGLLEHT